MTTNADEVIELRVSEVAQLFHTLDPFPFRERDLDREAEEFIVDWARELPINQPIRIVVHFPNSSALLGIHHAVAKKTRRDDRSVEIVLGSCEAGQFSWSTTSCRPVARLWLAHEQSSRPVPPQSMRSSLTPCLHQSL
jgi:hypothetical protein